MGKKLELKGKRFGSWVVLEEVGRNKHNSVVWLCRCDCGNEKIVGGSSIVSGKSKSCGHLRTNLSLKGKRFGRWSVLKQMCSNKHKQTMWLCRCDCGTESIVMGGNLVAGTSVSCGCFKNEVTSKRSKGKNNPMYGKKGKDSPNFGKKGKDNPNFGIPLTQEHKNNISKGLKDRKPDDTYHRRSGVMKNDIALYNTYGPQLIQFNFEEVRMHMILVDGVVYKSLQVRCHNSDCKKWFVPSRSQVMHRLQVFKGHRSGQHDFYCDDRCKGTCSTFHKVKYREGQNPNKQEKPYTQEQYQLYRTTVLERENYKCEYCGEEATEVHHEKSQKTDPMFVVDPDYGHAVCKKCHMKYGHKKGTECSTGALARKIC